MVNTHTAHLSLVNSLGLDTDQGGSLVAFYPVFSNINHACLANTKPVKVTIQLMSYYQKLVQIDGSQDHK